jgi:hypothetical protein
VHRGVHEAVDEDRAGFLVHLVLHRLPVHGDLDDHVEIVGEIFSGWNLIQTHAAAPCGVKNEGANCSIGAIILRFQPGTSDQRTIRSNCPHISQVEWVKA